MMSIMKTILALGIESSCDETSVAIVDSKKNILAQLVSSQIDIHKKYGGVIPEIAAREHLKRLPLLIQQLFDNSGVHLSEIDIIAATTGPGLIGGLTIGTMCGKAIAASVNKPFISVNHLEGHALTARLTGTAEFPFALLLVSGGHSQFLLVRSLGKYELIGTTLDDAVGECFDKVAKMLSLPYPGGPEIERLAKLGDTQKYSFTPPMKGHPSCNFSFSGLKTAVRYKIQEFKEGISESEKADIAASFQKAVEKSLSERVAKCLGKAIELDPLCKTLVVAGGVAANQSIGNALRKVCSALDVDFIAPPISLCTDNGAMIAWAGMEHYLSGRISSLDIKPRPRWPLSELYKES
jgi:N6-L-threonylcarbamoyladenine synthase